MIGSSYPSLEAFYAARPPRRLSRERDLGLLWRAEDETTYRAAWVQATREVYLYRHGHPEDGGGTVDVLERRFEPGELVWSFAGYREVCGRPSSLDWFLERAGGRMPLARSA